MESTALITFFALYFQNLNSFIIYELINIGIKISYQTISLLTRNNRSNIRIELCHSEKNCTFYPALKITLPRQ